MSNQPIGTAEKPSTSGQTANGHDKEKLIAAVTERVWALWQQELRHERERRGIRR